MLDNELIKIFIPIINAGMISIGLNDVLIQQAYHPHQQGEDDQRSLYFQLVYSNPFGYLQRYEVWNETNLNFDHFEVQHYETLFQFSARAIQNPADINSVTASDVLNSALHSLQSDYAVKTFFENNVQILRIGETRNLFFLDDRDRQESYPSFDIIFKHLNVYQTVTPMVQSVNSGIYAI